MLKIRNGIKGENKDAILESTELKAALVLPKFQKHFTLSFLPCEEETLATSQMQRLIATYDEI